jgi:hypothetical protein
VPGSVTEITAGLTFGGAAIAAAAIATATAAACRRTRNRTACLAAALAVLAGTAAGLWLVGGLLRLPPRVAIGRLLVIGLPLAAIAEAIAVEAGLGRVATVVRGVTALTLVRVLLHDSVHLQMEETAANATVLTAAGLAAIGWPIAVAGERRDDGGVVTVLAVVLALAAAAVAIPMAGYVKGGLVAALLAAAAGGALAGGGRVGLTGFSFAALVGIVVVGRFFGGLSSSTALLLCSPPILTVAVGRVGDSFGDVAAGRVIRSAACRLALAIVPLVVVIAHGWHDFDRSFRQILSPPAGPDASPSSSILQEQSWRMESLFDLAAATLDVSLAAPRGSGGRIRTSSGRRRDGGFRGARNC